MNHSCCPCPQSIPEVQLKISMVVPRIEKLSRCVCASLAAGTLMLGLAAIAATIAVAFYHRVFYSMSPDLCPRNVVQFDEYLCAGEDFRTNPTPTKPFSVIFGSFSPLSRKIDFRIKLNLTSPVDLNMVYSIYTINTLEAVSSGTADDELGPPPPPPPHEHEWVGWSYAQNSPGSWKLLEKQSFSAKRLKNHGTKSKPPSITFYKKDGIDENYYKLEVSALSFSNSSAVASIFFEAAPGSKEDGVLSVVLICVGIAVGAAIFIHISWMLHLSWAGKFLELPVFPKLSILMSLCALLSFTPLSLVQYFDDTFEYIIANSALEQLSMIGSLILLLVTCRRLLISIPDEFVQLVKLLPFTRGKAPVIVASAFAVIGSTSISLCHIDPALGKSYTITAYIFATLALIAYAISLILMFIMVDCMRRARAYIEAKRIYYLTFSCVVWEALILLTTIAYVIWHPGALQAYDVLHFNHLMVCALFAELMCPASESKKLKKKDPEFDSSNEKPFFYDDTMTTSGGYDITNSNDNVNIL